MADVWLVCMFYITAEENFFIKRNLLKCACLRYLLNVFFHEALGVRLYSIVGIYIKQLISSGDYCNHAAEILHMLCAESYDNSSLKFDPCCWPKKLVFIICTMFFRTQSSCLKQFVP